MRAELKSRTDELEKAQKTIIEQKQKIKILRGEKDELETTIDGLSARVVS